jgi:RNA 2',3'-cyclic 3'-phosphodiesterase
MPRLFVGIELPEPVRLRLEDLGGPLPGARWVDAEDMHITLRFAGDIDNRTADEFAEALASVSIAPFPVRITELGAFGGREPRSIYAGVDGGERLEALRRATERAARSAGMEPESRTWKPHVTIARLKGTSSEQVARFLGSCARLVVEPFLVDRFVLFSSRPKVGGGPYVIEEAYPLI